MWAQSFFFCVLVVRNSAGEVSIELNQSSLEYALTGVESRQSLVLEIRASHMLSSLSALNKVSF